MKSDDKRSLDKTPVPKQKVTSGTVYAKPKTPQNRYTPILSENFIKIIE